MDETFTVPMGKGLTTSAIIADYCYQYSSAQWAA